MSEPVVVVYAVSVDTKFERYSVKRSLGECLVVVV
jgi:hypothetical protein